MQDEPSQSMQVELYAASLRADYSDAGAFLEALAAKFEGALPAHTRVTRHASLFSRERPVKEIAVTLGDFQYRIGRERQGPLLAQRSHVVRGIVLSSEHIQVEQWIEEVAEALAQLAAHNQQAHMALSRFLIR
jgi:signal transduction histidine kinase